MAHVDPWSMANGELAAARLEAHSYALQNKKLKERLELLEIAHDTHIKVLNNNLASRERTLERLELAYANLLKGNAASREHQFDRIRDLTAECESLEAQLGVYIDMQERLITRLSALPELLELVERYQTEDLLEK